MKPSMKYLFIFFGIVTLCTADGWIQIKSESGIKIFLDGNFKGTTNTEHGGLVLEKVVPGNHTLKAVKSGFAPQSQQMSVKTGEVAVVTLKSFVPRISISQKGDESSQTVKAEVGHLVIKSVPVECSVSIPSLGIDSQKEKQEWAAEKVPAGEYIITSKGLNKTLTCTVKIEPGKTVNVFLNFLKEDVTSEVSELMVIEKLSLKLKYIEPKDIQVALKYRELYRIKEISALKQPFWIGITEVTQSQYEKIMGNNPSYFRGKDNHPVESVTWHDAVLFCKRLTIKERSLGNLPPDMEYRLPTVKEWLYCAYAGHDQSGTYDRDAFAWYRANSGNETHPVAQKKANMLGLFDMDGNVAEFAGDKYSSFIDAGHKWEQTTYLGANCYHRTDSYPETSVNSVGGNNTRGFRIVCAKR